MSSSFSNRAVCALAVAGLAAPSTFAGDAVAVDYTNGNVITYCSANRTDDFKSMEDAKARVQWTSVNKYNSPNATVVHGSDQTTFVAVGRGKLDGKWVFAVATGVTKEEAHAAAIAEVKKLGDVQGISVPSEYFTYGTPKTQ